MSARTCFSEVLYRWRWAVSFFVLASRATLAVSGFNRLGTCSRQVDTLADVPPETSEPKPSLRFDF